MLTYLFPVPICPTERRCPSSPLPATGDRGFESIFLPRRVGRTRIAFAQLHSVATSESFAAEVKSETIAITHPGKFGQFRQNRNPHGAIHPARSIWSHRHA